MDEKNGICDKCGACFSESATPAKWNPATCDCGGRIITTTPEIENRSYAIGYAHACGYRD